MTNILFLITASDHWTHEDADTPDGTDGPLDGASCCAVRSLSPLCPGAPGQVGLPEPGVLQAAASRAG